MKLLTVKYLNSVQSKTNSNHRNLKRRRSKLQRLLTNLLPRNQKKLPHLRTFQTPSMMILTCTLWGRSPSELFQGNKRKRPTRFKKGLAKKTLHLKTISQLLSFWNWPPWSGRRVQTDRKGNSRRNRRYKLLERSISNGRHNYKLQVVLALFQAEVIQRQEAIQ